MSYTIKLKGRTDTFTVQDREGEFIARAHERYQTQKQDTFLKFNFAQFNASSINSIDIHRARVVDETKEKELQEQSRYERTVLALPPRERATHFARRYYLFYFKGRTSNNATDADIATAIDTLTQWFTDNPKRLVPDPQVMFELAPIGKPSTLHNALYGFYLNALDRDYKQVAYRK